MEFDGFSAFLCSCSCSCAVLVVLGGPCCAWYGCFCITEELLSCCCFCGSFFCCGRPVEYGFRTAPKLFELVLPWVLLLPPIVGLKYGFMLFFDRVDAGFESDGGGR